MLVLGINVIISSILSLYLYQMRGKGCRWIFLNQLEHFVERNQRNDWLNQPAFDLLFFFLEFLNKTKKGLLLLLCETYLGEMRWFIFL